jgi:acetyl esterase/lipase
MNPAFLRRAAAWLAALMLSACSPADLLNATIPTGSLTITRNVPYGTDARQTLDIYQPATPQPGRPAVVFLFGGSWDSGDKSTYPFVAATLARHGLLVFVPNYRLYPQVQYPVFLEDCARATVWAQDHAAQYGGRADDVFLMGHSAGAYNAAMLTLDPALLAAAGGDRDSLRGMIGLAGPYDFLPMTDPEVIGVFAGRKDDPTTQPIHYVTGHAPPLLLLAGSADNRVMPKNTVNLAAAARDHGGDVVSHIYPGVGHVGLVISIAPIFQGKDPALADTLRFIDRHKLHGDAAP